MALHDLTAVFASPTVDWSGSREQFAQRFDRCVSEITHGIYVQYFENDANVPVFDKNQRFSHGGNGALVIHASGASLKPGKFEGGLVHRRRQDADHLHRVRGEVIGLTYADCLKLALVLDLSRQDVEATKRGEKFLKQRVDGYIARNALLRADATRHGDWRRLSARISLQELRSTARDILQATAADLDEVTDTVRDGYSYSPKGT